LHPEDTRTELTIRNVLKASADIELELLREGQQPLHGAERRPELEPELAERG
jgi:hypothetical protein